MSGKNIVGHSSVGQTYKTRKIYILYDPRENNIKFFYHKLQSKCIIFYHGNL